MDSSLWFQLLNADQTVVSTDSTSIVAGSTGTLAGASIALPDPGGYWLQADTHVDVAGAGTGTGTGGIVASLKDLTAGSVITDTERLVAVTGDGKGYGSISTIYETLFPCTVDILFKLIGDAGSGAIRSNVDGRTSLRWTKIANLPAGGYWPETHFAARFFPTTYFPKDR